ncbi:hypothetical protein RJ639_033540 [Escallonia herrerae]|uniref:Transmembrane protein 135 N-terminal domain-containing protein n=1 Tax=Escallonia herrerae TaxID=1293975 RepID=A0AA88X8D0_9ASTE|nr:hypothetical protein RJ639_033540 [Escallonia herrerae]
MPQSGDGTDVTDGRCTCSSGDGGKDRACPHCRRSALPSSSSSSCSLLSFESYPVKDYSELWRVFTASVKGFTIGAGLKGGLSLFAILARLRRRRLLTSARKAEMASSGEDVILAIKETLRYGLFLGTFAGTFVSVDETIAALGGHRRHFRTAKWRALLAGAIAGPSMLLTGLNTEHTSLAVYILIRAAVLASRCGIKSRRFGGICKPLTWAHGDIFLMCLSSSQILSAYILKQDSLPSSYKSFLNKHGGKDAAILQAVKEIACGMPFSNLKAVEKYYKTTGVDIELDPQMKVPCSVCLVQLLALLIIHGNQSCGGHFLSFLLQAYKRALPVYLPVYLIPALIVHRQGLSKSSLLHLYLLEGFLLKKTLHNFGERSSGYCEIKFVSVSLLFVCLLPTGLALAIEKKSRRIEISLYCLARAIESFFTCMADVGYLPQSKKIRRADVVIFSISTAIIMHCYAIERDVFRSKYLNVLDWVFGVPLPPSDATPRKNW